MRIFKAIRFNPEQDVIINCDNQQLVRIVIKETPIVSTKLQHVDIHQFWLRQEVQNGSFVVQWVLTSEIVTDRLTKALSKQNHQKFVNVVGLRDIRHLVN